MYEALEPEGRCVGKRAGVFTALKCQYLDLILHLHLRRTSSRSE